jgi:predicted RND superfamily exporter protein
MIPARQLGIVAAAGIIFALVLSLLLIPALLSVLGKSKPVLKQHGTSGHLLERVLERTGNAVVTRPARIILLSALISLASGIGIIWLKVDTNLESFFPEKHEVRISAGLINNIFGGSQNISILVEGDIKDPDLLGRIDHYQEVLKDHPNVGNVSSIAMVIREISKALNEPGDSLYDAIPSSRNAVAQYLELYSMSGDPGDLEKLVDFDYLNAQIMVRINDGSNASLKSVLSEIERITAGDEHVTRIGGSGLVAADLGDMVVRGQVISLLVALMIIILVISVIFRSLEAGLISAVPLGLAMILLFGWMGYLGIRLDVATALLSSIMIGVGVDYTIHFLWRYRAEKQERLKSAAAIKKTLLTTGRGITFNALSVVLGFSALPFSMFPTLRFFGFLVMVSIIACLVGALVIIPALVLVFRPAFLEPGKPDKREYLNLRVRFVTRVFRRGLANARNQLSL